MPSEHAEAPLASEKTSNLLLEQIDRARQTGATIGLGGDRLDRPGYFLEPTAITGIDERNPVFNRELFDPAAAFHVVDSTASAIALANATPFGLGT
ncbi:hypothetical protein A1355_18385 [Methylomonas koyamae]|uniref:Aldehyde dehydrogenase domain-containing protein n=1 Tax=Methylomonas koyamae TaxID=702114 RepID=A0A177P9Z7_9GAMM|nr:hypothetical protein A1355_18385 [Methylomonas koyamae]